MRRLICKEIEADTKTFGDERRTLIHEEKKVVAEVKVVDEPTTVIISEKGWVRTRQGHGVDAATLSFKAGDSLYGIFECRTVDTLVAQHLLKTVTAIRLMGADCIISGVRPQIAQTIVHLGLDLQGVVTKANLADALALSLKRLGVTVTKAV